MMYLNTICSHVELSKRRHFSDCGQSALKRRPRIRVSYLIQIRKAIRLTLNRCRALSSPRPPSARAVYVCVQDPSEASLGFLLLEQLKWEHNQ